MKKQFLKVSSLLLMLIVLNLSLSGCQGDLLSKGKNQLALESKNMELESEVESLKAQLAIYEKDQDAELEPSSQESEHSAAETVELTSKETDIEYEKMSPEEWLASFKYEGNLEINGRKAREMTREELEALPPIVQEYTDSSGAKRQLGQNGAENLFEQLAFAAYMQYSLADLGGPPVDDKVLKPVQEDLMPGDYDISEKSLVIHRDAASTMRLVYELDKEQSTILNTWIEENLQDTVEPFEDFSYDTELITSNGESLFFKEAEFLEPKGKQEAKLKKNAEFFTMKLKDEAAEELRKLLEEARMHPIFDETAFYENYPEAEHPTNLMLSFLEKPTAEQAQISIRNFADENIIYTNLYSLAYYNGEEWETILPVKAGDCFTVKEYKIASGEERKFEITYADCYEKLPAGYYRISLDFVKDNLEAEASETRKTENEEYSIFFAIN